MAVDHCRGSISLSEPSLTGLETSPDGLSWPKRFAEAAVFSKGQRSVGDSGHYAPRGVNHSQHTGHQAGQAKQSEHRVQETH